MRLIIGLGNPGKKYEKTRHNAGFLAVDFLVNQQKGKINPKLQTWLLKQANIIYAKPQTFMNESGRAVRALASYFKIKPKNIIIIYDEIDLPFGTIRVRNKGSSAGHNGIKSVIEHLGTEEFWRIRIGIANNKKEKMPAEKFVLKKFSRTEQRELKQKILPEVKEKIDNLIT